MLFNPNRNLSSLETFFAEPDILQGQQLKTFHAVIAAAIGKTDTGKTYWDELPKLPNHWKNLHNYQYGELFKQAA